MPIYDSDEPIFFDTGLRYDMDEPPANSRRLRQMNSSSLRISRFVTRLSAKLRFESAGKQVAAFELRKTSCAAPGIGVLRIGDSKTSAFPIWRLGTRDQRACLRNSVSKAPASRLRVRTAQDLVRPARYRRFANRRFEDKCVPNLEIGNEGNSNESLP